MPSGSKTASVEVAVEVDARFTRHRGRDHAEPVVRVDPPLSGLGHHPIGVHRVTGGVGQQMTHRRTRRPCGGVEFEHTLLDRDLNSPGNQRLGHRRQPEPMTPRRRARPEHRTVRPPPRRQSGQASRRSRREQASRRSLIRALHAEQIAATCRASVPQHPPSTVTAGSRSRSAACRAPSRADRPRRVRLPRRVRRGFSVRRSHAGRRAAAAMLRRVPAHARNVSGARS